MTTPLQPVGWGETQLAVPGSHARLALRHCTPQGQQALARVVLAAAVGVPQTFYSAFAEWLAARGYVVTTFDYRGHGASLHGPLRLAKADLLDWAQDCLAVAQQLRAQDAAQGVQRPLLWVGHSVGAQLPGLCQPALPIDGLLAIASGSGYWRDNAPPTKRKALLWWWLVQPVVTTLCGCLPGRRLGLVGDLPAGVAWQWRRWCMHPDYSLGVEGEAVRQRFAAVRYPVHALSITDDEMMSLRSTQSLVSWYSQAPQRLERLQPGDAGVTRIGHFGFFRRAMADSLWPRAEAVLRAWLQGAAHSMEPERQMPEADSATVAGQNRPPPTTMVRRTS